MMMRVIDFLAEAGTQASRDKLAQLRKAKNSSPLAKPITRKELADLEKSLDLLFKHLNVDIEFSRHFFERLSDARNGKEITLAELNNLFRKVHRKFGLTISTSPDKLEAVIKDISSKLNVPFAINLKRGEIELISKTIMRKNNFKTPNKVLKV